MPAVSKAQRKLFALALAVKRGEVDAATVDQKIRDLSKKKETDLKDFAETPEETLPNKLEDSVEEGIFSIFKKARDTDPGDPGWYDPIAREALEILQKKDKKWKNYELAAMGPGNSKNYMHMAISDSKRKDYAPEHQFKVHFNKQTDEVTKVEAIGLYKESVDESGHEYVHISPNANKLKLAIKQQEKEARLKINRGKEPEFEQLSLNKIMLSKVLGREELSPEHEDAYLRLLKKFNLKESVNEAKKYVWDDLLDVLMTIGGTGKILDRINMKDQEVEELLDPKYRSYPEFAKAVKSMYNLKEKYLREAESYAEAMKYALEENNTMATPGSVNGMGNISMPGDPGTQTSFVGQETGSGDLASDSELTDEEKGKKIYKFLKYNAFIEESVNEENERQWKATEKKWLKFQRNSGKQAANDPKSFVKDAYDNGFDKDRIIDALKYLGNHDQDTAETYYFNIVGQYESITEAKKVTHKKIDKLINSLEKVTQELKDNFPLFKDAKTDEDKSKYRQIAIDKTKEKKSLDKQLEDMIKDFEKNTELDPTAFENLKSI